MEHHLLWEELCEPYGNLRVQYNARAREELSYVEPLVGTRASAQPEPKRYLAPLDKPSKRDYSEGMNMKQNAHSAAAYRTIQHVTPTMRQVVFDLLTERGPIGATDDEVEFITGMRHQTASARRRELVIKGLVVDSGRSKPTRSGRMATIWVLSEEQPTRKTLQLDLTLDSNQRLADAG